MMEKAGISQFQEKIKIFIAPGKEEFFQYQRNKFLPPWAVGTAYSHELLVFVLSPWAINTSLKAAKKTVFHEVAHLIVDQCLGKKEIPRWLSEGLAMYLSNEWEVLNSVELARAALGGYLYPLSMLGSYFPEKAHRANLAYSQSASFVWFLVGQAGSVKNLLDSIYHAPSWKVGIKKATGNGVYYLFSQWKKRVRRRYTWISILGSATTFWFLMSIFFILSYVFKRHRTRKKMEQMDQEENGFSSPDNLLH